MNSELSKIEESDTDFQKALLVERTGRIRLRYNAEELS
jgi:hypothetical protein